MSSITPELSSQIASAIEAIPAPHREPPIHGTIVADPTVAFVRIQDWAFTQGYAFVTESKNDRRVRFKCIHHKNETQNTRKTEEKDRKRIQTLVRGTGCSVGNNIILQYIALFEAYYISTILRILISY